MSDPPVRSRIHDLRPTIGAIILFVISLLVGSAGIGYAAYSFGATQNSIIETQNSISATVQHNLSASNRRWCDVLALLTSVAVPKPASPKSNPSRETDYKLYIDFVDLRKGFGCPPP